MTDVRNSLKASQLDLFTSFQTDTQQATLNFELSDLVQYLSIFSLQL